VPHQAVTLIPEPFSVENGLLTPTFKLKRPQAKAAYQAVIDRMYDQLPVEEGPPHPSVVGSK
jgi:long-chain acyl-CoA synthetase